MSDTSCGCTHQYFCFGVVFFDCFSQCVFYMVSNFNGCQSQSVVTVNGAFDAACPCEGFFGAQENCTDGQQVFCDLFFKFHIYILLKMVIILKIRKHIFCKLLRDQLPV